MLNDFVDKFKEKLNAVHLFIGLNINVKKYVINSYIDIKVTIYNALAVITLLIYLL